MNFIDVRDTNATYGAKLVEMAEKYPQLVVLEADLGKASGSMVFKDKYPERHYNVGIAEQNLVGFASGLAAVGKIPFASTFACFISQRSCDQIVNSVAYNNENVKLIGTYAGLTSEKNGGTHISVCDMAIVRAIPRIKVFDPGDAAEFEQILEYAAANVGPMYIRSNKGKFPVFHDADFKFEMGKAQCLRKGSSIGLITTGITTAEGIKACEEAAKLGISVYHLHMPTIKPIDKEAIADCMRATGCIITAENHSVIGGLGSTVANVVCETVPGEVYRLGLQDVFGETATLNYMMHKHGIDSDGILAGIMAHIK